jgi:D-alanyl-D-alanine carboxypeptidase/D-alanyl-D-alanine-endopeptidase (penicillin-binding protein 4)
MNCRSRDGRHRRLSRPAARKTRRLNLALTSFAIVLSFALAAGTSRLFAHPLQSTVLDLQRGIDAIVSGAGLDRTTWGVLVESLKTGETLYSHNADKLMMPASTLKVVTLAAAAERLGWGYSYETRILADGPIAGDTVSGNLVIVAGGDPSLTRRTLDLWAAQLKGLGIRAVKGTVLADSSRFAGPWLGTGWSWDDLAYYYAAPVTAAQFHENSVDLTLRPGPAPGSPPVYELTPPGISGLRIENRMTTGAATAQAEFTAQRAPNSPVVVIEGVVPARSRPVTHALSVHDPVRFLAAAFAEALFDGGIAVGSAPPQDANADSARDYSTVTPLLTYHSDPLRDLARRFLDVSQNQYGETFLKTMGVQAGTPTFDGGVKAVESVLMSWDIPVDGTVLRDGSGLSRYNYVTPATLVRVIEHMYREPLHREPFLSALTVAGRTGTIAGRLRNTAAAANARVKDGSMAGVRALCGVVNTARGEPLAFAILANGFTVPAGQTITAGIDAIVVELATLRR